LVEVATLLHMLSIGLHMCIDGMLWQTWERLRSGAVQLWAVQVWQPFMAGIDEHICATACLAAFVDTKSGTGAA
jgi:hypothetical protein